MLQRRWEVIPENAELASPHLMIKPWKELSEDKKANEARGMEVYAGMLDALDYSSNCAYGMGFASASAGPLDKFKMTISEGGIRTPLLISGPGISNNHQISSFAYVTDIMPTILELTGVSYPAEFQGRKIEPMRGRSMVGLLNKSQKAIYSPTDFIGGEMVGGKWMRQGDFKAVMLPAPYGNGEWQLFNIVKDPGEAKDLSKTMPGKMKTLKTAWDEYAKEVGVVLPN